MKKLPLILIALLTVGLSFNACSDGDSEAKAIYNWRENNIAWLAEMQSRTNSDGTPYYEMVVPNWDPSSFVLVHYFNERTTNPEALKPLYTSTVDVRYNLYLYNGTPCDSSSAMTENGPGIYRAQLNSLIDGWAAAVCDMNVGDTVEVIIPYALGYGSTSTGSIPAYSTLRFNIRLADIYRYEASPEISSSTSSSN